MSIPLQKAGAVQTFTHTIDRYVVRELALIHATYCPFAMKNKKKT